MLKGIFSGNAVPAKPPVFAPFAKIEKSHNELFHKIEGKSIVHDVRRNESFGNHIEMSGFLCSSIISYGYDKTGKLLIMRHVTFPTLRCYPNDTHSSLSYNFNGVTFVIDSADAKEIVEKITFDGILRIYTRSGEVSFVRELFTSRNNPCLAERITVTNNGEKSVNVAVKNNDGEVITAKKYGHDKKQYKLYCEIQNENINLKPNEQAVSAAFYCGLNLDDAYLNLNVDSEIKNRTDFLNELDGAMNIKTPDETINTMCRFAKIRACESIYKTKNGLMHSPGGGGYYAALWTNDQCEYINPLFGYLGYKTGFEQSVNCYNLYKKYISPEKAVITSIIAEGDGIWHGAKDRGDSAMYAYGASRFLLASGDRELAKNYMQAIDDCITYTLSQINSDGVVASDSDELENRFESGKANLSTSCIAYDALNSYSCLLDETGNREKADYYRKKAYELKENIEKYFGRNVEGYDTYRYCREEKRLRSWICMPLTVGIFDRAERTADALFSDKLRMEEGLVTRSGEKTFWDRSTLYALRGLFFSGETERSAELLERYSQVRLLGNHIPYAVEAYPEGNQAQLSAESGLYLRIFTEGILGLGPTGFKRFTVKPSLPDNWDYIEADNINICGEKIFIRAEKTDNGFIIKSSVRDDIVINKGETVEFDLEMSKNL